MPLDENNKGWGDPASNPLEDVKRTREHIRGHWEGRIRHDNIWNKYSMGEYEREMMRHMKGGLPNDLYSHIVVESGRMRGGRWKLPIVLNGTGWEFWGDEETVCIVCDEEFMRREPVVPQVEGPNKIHVLYHVQCWQITIQEMS